MKRERGEGSKRIEVRLPDGRAYPILIEREGFEGLEEILGETRQARRYAVVTDRRIEGLYGGQVRRVLRRMRVPFAFFRVPMGERAKDLRWASWLYDRILGAGFERASAVVALGGGSIGDLAGFVAATCLRGISYVQVPTTLLAQVDSSVGGKTGVNHRLGKNLVGAFHQPRGVYIQLSTLRSLPERDLRSGLAEVLKYGAIGDRDLVRFLETGAKREALLNGDAGAVEFIVTRSCQFKARVVEKDEREEGYRAVLNFGHTIGHAIERVVGYGRYRHGEAVAMGMNAAAQASMRMGFCSGEVAARLMGLIESYGLPTRIPGSLGAKELEEAIERDKKAAGGKIRFVALKAMGEVEFALVSARELASAALGI